MPQTANYGFPLLADTPPEGMTGKDLRDLILGESDTSLAQIVDAALKNVEDAIPNAQVQANWSQTDDTQPDYIKNKPAIPTLPKYTKVASSGNYNDLGCKPYGEIVILPEKRIAFSGNSLGIEGLYVSDVAEGEDNTLLQAQDALVPGERYVVVWDGTEYALTAGDVNDFYENEDGLTYLGNQSRLFGGIAGTPIDSGEPFIILSKNGTTIYIHTNTEGWHTVSVTPVNTVRRIDSKYLPEGLATTEEVALQLAAILPAYSAADNGKVLGIENGKLAWVKVQAAAGTGGVDASVDGSVLTLGDGATVDGNTLVLDGDASVDGSTLILGG